MRASDALMTITGQARGRYPVLDAAIRAYAKKLQHKPAGATLLALIDNHPLDVATNLPLIATTMAKAFPTADAWSIAEALCAYRTTFGQHTPQTLAAELEPYLQPFSVGGQVQTVGRLSQIDRWLEEHVPDLRWCEMGEFAESGGVAWEDRHTAEVRMQLELAGISEPKSPIPSGDILERVTARARLSSYHPVQEYLVTRCAQWDGHARLDQLWSWYFGAEPSPLMFRYASCFAIGAVRRVLQPGTKADWMPILLGPQGAYKSSGLRALCEGPGRDAFTDARPNFEHRAEMAMQLAGCWVWELAELEGFDRSESNTIKAFISREADRILLPYARLLVQRERRSVLIGSTNDEHCLRDTTGTRRTPVIRVGTIRKDDILRDRDQLWAEALYRCLRDEPHWLDRDGEAAQAEANAEHLAPDDEAWADAVQRWIAKPIGEHGLLPAADGAPATSFTLRQCGQQALGLTAERVVGPTATRLARVISRLGVRSMPGVRDESGYRPRRYPFVTLR